MPGKVYLVGAGPGDPGLITVKGLRLLETAEVVVYDRLVDQRLLDQANPSAEIINVGKFPGPGSTHQAEINALLIAKGTEGKRIVRLKGGDPFVFGRGGEEAEALVEAGIPFEVVPGITSAVAAPAYAGIPLTHRRVSSSFAVISGSEDPSKTESSIDWKGHAASGATLVVLMGWENLSRIVGSLTENGLPLTTPVALVRWGTEPYQQTVVGTLADIEKKGHEAGLSPPVIIVVGAVVNLRERLRWYDKGPLFGKRVLVTRSRRQASALSQLLLEQGALPIEAPAIELQPPASFEKLDSAISQLQSYDWTIFTSVNAVSIVFERLESMKEDARAFHSVRVAAIGPATAKALSEKGIIPDLVPEEYVSEALVEALRGHITPGTKILLPRAEVARATVPQSLRDMGAVVNQVDTYTTQGVAQSAQPVLDALSEGIDVATFASSSTVTNLLSLLNADASILRGTTIACIGPVTAETARQKGLKVDIVAQEYTIPGLVNALIEHFQSEVPAHGSIS